MNIIANPPQKVKAMYDAVLSEMNEGTQMHSLTVSAITKKAGIGKGTAYEYFSSKEEIISHALVYHIINRIKEYRGELEKVDGFENKIEYSLMWIMKNYTGEAAARQVLSGMLSSGDTASKMKKNMMESQGCGMDKLMDIINIIIEEGKKEDYFREDTEEFEWMSALLSQVSMFLLFLNHKLRGDYANLPSDEKAKELVIKNIRILVGKPSCG